MSEEKEEMGQLKLTLPVSLIMRIESEYRRLGFINAQEFIRSIIIEKLGSSKNPSSDKEASA